MENRGFDPPHEDSLRQGLIRMIKGAVIGIGAILPGLSGGVLSVILGLYNPLMRFLSRPFYRLKENFRFFFPIAVGGGLGVLLFAFLVSAALDSYEALFTCLFIGLVIGTFPSLYKEAGKEGRDHNDILLMRTSATVLFLIMYMGNQSLITVEPNMLVWFLCGFAVGLGVVVPGMSPSNFLIYFGLYKPMSDAIKSLEIGAIVALALGGLCSVLLLSRAVTALLDKAYSKVYHLILGLVIGSSLAVFPTVVFPALAPDSLARMQLSKGQAILYCVLMGIAGIVISWLFGRLEAKTDIDELDNMSKQCSN